MRINSLSLVFTTALALSLHGTGAAAGAADVSTSDGSKIKFEYRGTDRLRVNMQEQPSYMVVRDGQVYAVTDADGQTMVVNLNQAMAMFSGMASSASPTTVQGKFISLKPTGRKETVAGLQGEVYLARYVDEQGVEQSDEVVLSADQRAIDFQRAMAGMAKGMAEAAQREHDGAEAMYKELKSMKKGILRYGKELTVTAISDRDVAESRFELPAEPTDLSAMQGMFGGGQSGTGQQEKSGGFMSGMLGALGQKSASQQDRTEEKAKGQAEKETDEAVDNVLDKAFDKLFGK